MANQQPGSNAGSPGSSPGGLGGTNVIDNSADDRDINGEVIPAGGLDDDRPPGAASPVATLPAAAEPSAPSPTEAIEPVIPLAITTPVATSLQNPNRVLVREVDTSLLDRLLPLINYIPSPPLDLGVSWIAPATLSLKLRNAFVTDLPK